MKVPWIYLTLSALILSACQVGSTITKIANRSASQTPSHIFTQTPISPNTPFLVPKTPTTTPSLVKVTATQSPTPFPKIISTVATSVQARINWQFKNRMMVPVVSFISLQEGWAASDTQLIHTIDGGITWQMVADIPEPFSSLDFVSSIHGWGMGKEWLYVTNDGGRTWKRQLSRPFDIKRGIWNLDIDFINDQIGWLTDDMDLFRTQDGGETWHKVEIPNSSSSTLLLSVSFTSTEKGWLMKGDCVMPMCDLTLLKTIDGGETWKPVSVEVNGEEKQARPSMRPPHEIYFLDDQHGWFVGSINFLGEITDDGGRTWKGLQPEFYMGGGGIALRQIHMFNPLQGIANLQTGSYYAVVRTDDGGNNWTQIFPPLIPNIKLQFFDLENGFGLNGGEYRSYSYLSTGDGGITWQIWDFNSPCVYYWFYLHFVDRKTGWGTCGFAGPLALFNTSDGGRTWQRIATPNPSFAIARFWDARTGIIGDYKNNIYGTQDGGKTWKLVQVSQEKFPLQADQAGWMVDINGIIYHAGKTDANWIPVLGYGYLSQFDRVSDSVAYGISRDFSNLVKTIDGGKTWMEISIDNMIKPNHYFSISFIDQNNGWLASNQGLFRTEDGGMNWDQILPRISR